MNVIADSMLKHQRIKQSPGVPGILTAYHEWSLEPAKEEALVMQRETYLGVEALLYDPARVELPIRKALKT